MDVDLHTTLSALGGLDDSGLGDVLGWYGGTDWLG